MGDFFYCSNLNEYTRLKTRVVHIGHVPMGGAYPIRIQSMTNTNTLDTQATVEQCIRIIEAGADYVRITAPGIPEAENLGNIKKALLQKGYRTPLVADIHFNPHAAEVAAKYVEKVRINPGNYVDKKQAHQIEFTDEEYRQELARIRERLLPLIKICKEHKTAIRIGTNHGSLSDRIVNRYGDTPEGMAESAMEFVRIFAAEDFHELVLSMKASNTRIMVQATRRLVNLMAAEGFNYPLHLGVTEAGDGEDGRIRSAVGIGALLADGLGDTIRVSLTEDPELEIPVAKMLVDHFTQPIVRVRKDMPEPRFNPFVYQKRETISVGPVGGSQVPVVISSALVNAPADQQPDLVLFSDTRSFKGAFRPLLNYTQWLQLPEADRQSVYPLMSSYEYLKATELSEVLHLVLLDRESLSRELIDRLKADPRAVLVIEDEPGSGFAAERCLISGLNEAGCKNPIVLRKNYTENNAISLSIKAAADTGGLFLDGLADGIWLDNNGSVTPEQLNSIAFGILQASRVRTTKTEYISCPSCGRTLFNLMEVTAQIKERTSHLKGLKIGIMGCIVNGPGEMADADYGYVGAGPGKINLYKGQQVIKKAINQDEAVNQLIDLIKEHGDWVEP